MKNYIVIKICWLLPLVLGLLIFFTWLVTKIDILMVAGIFDIYLGIALTIIGLVIGTYKLIQNIRKNMKTENIKIFILLLLLLSNIPIGFGVLYSAFMIKTGFVTKIINQTSEVVNNCVITGGGVEEIVGTIKPNEKIIKTVWIKQDGTLDLKYELDGKEKVINIEDYVTHSMGGNKIIEIKE